MRRNDDGYYSLDEFRKRVEDVIAYLGWQSSPRSKWIVLDETVWWPAWFYEVLLFCIYNTITNIFSLVNEPVWRAY